MLDELLRHGADPNLIDVFDRAPMQVALKSNVPSEIIDMLCDYGCKYQQVPDSAKSSRTQPKSFLSEEQEESILSEEERKSSPSNEEPSRTPTKKQ